MSYLSYNLSWEETGRGEIIPELLHIEAHLYLVNLKIWFI